MTAILQRKLAAAQRDSPNGDMTVLRALRLSMARTAEELFGLALAVIGATQQRLSSEALSEALSDDDLLIVLDCPGGQTGVAAVSLTLTTSLLQQQTMGQVSDRAPDPRPFTDTDAALTAPLIEAVLQRVSDMAPPEGDQGCFNGIRFGARGEDVRTVCLGLRAPRYRAFRLNVDIALGAHQADVLVLLPDTADAEPTDVEDGSCDGAMERVARSPMLEVAAPVTAVLARIRLQIGKLNDLSVGDVLPLERDRLDDTTIETHNGRVLARGRLGQMNGRRAVRLMTDAPLPKVASGLDMSGFDPLSAHRSAPELPKPQEVDFSDQAAMDPALQIDALASLSPEEAAQEITELAGLSDIQGDVGQDTPLTGSDFPMGALDTPADGDLSAKLGALSADPPQMPGDGD